MRLAYGSILLAVLAIGCGGGGGGDDDGDDTATPPTAYRADTIEVRDPHMFALDGAVDVTTTVNGQIATGVTEDGDDPPDGQLDLSLMVVFRPLDMAAASGSADAVVNAACTAPITTVMCSLDADSRVIATTATNADTGCYTLDNTLLGGYDPAPTIPAGPCFSTDPEQVTLTVAGVDLTLEDTIVTADYGATGAPDRLENGLMVGFMTQATADATILPDDLPVVGGMQLSALLKVEDQDQGPGGTGWYFFINFTAATVPFTE